MNLSLNLIAKHTKKLVAFPAVVDQLFNVIDNEISDAQNIAKVIQKDPALTASLLKLANSAWYMAREAVSSIEHAVVRIGTRDIGKIALNVCVQDSFKDVPENLLSLEDYFSHSLRCALAAQEIASSSNVGRVGAMYAAGLLHDVGKLILLNLYPEQSTEALTLNLDMYDGTKLEVCEKEIFGFDHTEVGNVLAKQWSFPAVLQQCIRYHHNPDDAVQSKKEVCCIHLANTIATLNELDSDDLLDGPKIDETVWETINQDPGDIISLLEGSKNAYINNRDKMSMH